MKRFTNLLLLLFLSASTTYAQNVRVSLHFDPPVDDFTFVYVAGTFNGWTNNQILLTDPDEDGVYEVSRRMPVGEQMYKFVLDADWGKAYTDPDNPRVNTSDNNNSMLTVSDPMITYLLPKDGSTDTTSAGLPIRAIIDFADGNPIDPNTLVVVIDGDTLESPATYYDETKREFNYLPPSPLGNGEHTVEVSASSATGSISRTSTFTRDPNLVVYFVPTQFGFDTHSTFFNFAGDINTVSLVGDFNQWNRNVDVMSDDDGDGAWSAKADLQEGYWEYKFLINGSLYLTDPDNPDMNPDDNNNSFLTVVADSTPSVQLLQPAAGAIYSAPQQVGFKALLAPGVRGGAVNAASIMVKLNSASVPFTFDETLSEVTATLDLNSEGTHDLKIAFSNEKGLSTESSFAFGLYPEDSGSHFVDEKGDEQYSYPAGVADGSGDIFSFHIAASEEFDSLEISIEMADITDNTRLGLLISNPVSGVYAEAQAGLDIETGDWDSQGIFAVLSQPGNAYESAEKENRFQISRIPVQYGEAIEVNGDASSTNIFQFKISIAYLDSLLGSWTRERNFSLFSYIVTDGSGAGYEVTGSEGGLDFNEDPDIYDAVFVRNSYWQSRILNNYIVPGKAGGPRLSRLDGVGRGLAALTATDISDSLAVYGPVITFFTPGVTYRNADVTVAGVISDTTVTTATLYFNEEESEIPVTGGMFAQAVTLVEGANAVRVAATDNRGFRSETSDLILTLEVDHDPRVEITGSVSQRVVSLQAGGLSPGELILTYTWTQDADNPAALEFSSTTGPDISVTVPLAEGEYYLNVTVTDPENRSFTARRYIVSDSSSVALNTLTDHAGWIDDAVFYEIYPRSFSEQGGFAGITAKIDEIVDLGVDAIWLMPIFEGPTPHGYEITDYFTVETDYGTEQEFRTLVETLHDAGLRIILDFVVNHTSIQHPFMQNVLQFKEYSPWADYYVWDGNPGDSNYQFYFNWASLPNTNMVNAEVREYFLKVAEYWVQNFDVDGYRCDVAWGVEERTNEFWPEWRKRLKNIKPEVFLQAEASSSESVYYNNRFDSANDWNLRSRIIDNINSTATVDALDAELRRSYPAHARPFRFMENHDEVRMAASHDGQRSKLAHTILMTANGVPMIYAGGEVGETTIRDMIDWSDPDNLRPFFKNLIDIRHKYIRNPEITRISNSQSRLAYSYLSQSGEHLVVTVANFRNRTVDLTMNLSGLPNGGVGPYYLSDLVNGAATVVDASQLAAYPLSLEPFGFRVFYFGSSKVTSVEDFTTATIPGEFSLYQNYPNPFNPTTRIRFDLPKAGEVRLKIFNLRGQVVRTLLYENKSAGSHFVDWNGKDESGRLVSSGTYFYQIRTDSGVRTQKMLFLK